MGKRKYKVGDKVRIKNIKWKESDLYIYGISSNMERYANKVLTIDYILDNMDPDLVIYKMKEDKHLWNWSISMFVPFNKSFIDLNCIV